VIGLVRDNNYCIDANSIQSGFYRHAVVVIGLVRDNNYDTKTRYRVAPRHPALVVGKS